MRKLIDVPIAKNCPQQLGLWLYIIVFAWWKCPDAYAQVEKAPGGLPAAETSFRNFPGLHGKDRLTAFVRARDAKRMSQYLTAPHGYSPRLAKTFKNNTDSLIRLALLQH